MAIDLTTPGANVFTAAEKLGFALVRLGPGSAVHWDGGNTFGHGSHDMRATCLTCKFQLGVTLLRGDLIEKLFDPLKSHYDICSNLLTDDLVLREVERAVKAAFDEHRAGRLLKRVGEWRDKAAKRRPD